MVRSNTRHSKQKITDERYHDTMLLLKKYRDVVWSLTVAVEQAKSDFRECYGGSIDEFLDSIYLAGAELGGTEIEERAKSIERSNKMLNLVDSAVNTMRIKHKTGELFYQVLYFNYLSPNEYRTNEDIVTALEEAGYPMCYRTMTNYRTLAVECVGSILWGYTAREMEAILGEFV